MDDSVSSYRDYFFPAALCITFWLSLDISANNPTPILTLPLEGGGMGGGEFFWLRLCRAMFSVPLW